MIKPRRPLTPEEIEREKWAVEVSKANTLRYYLHEFRTADPKDLKLHRKALEEEFNAIIEKSQDTWILVVESEQERELFILKHDFDINTAVVSGVGFSDLINGTVIGLRRNEYEANSRELPLTEIPEETIIIPLDMYMKSLGQETE